MDSVTTEIPESYKWYQVWAKIYLHPFEQSFREILEDPKFHVKRAFFWVLISGAMAAFLVSVVSSGQDSAFSNVLLSCVCLGPLIGALALLLISLPAFYASGQLGTEKDKNRLVYCVAAALSPTFLIYGLLLAAGIALPKLSVNIDPVFYALAIFPTVYLVWLLKNAFKAVMNLAPEMTRSSGSINKSLATNAGLLALTALGACAVYFFYWVPRESSKRTLYFFSLVVFVVAVYWILQLISNFIEFLTTKRLSEQGQEASGTVLKKWVVEWVQVTRFQNRLSYTRKYAYYATFDIAIGGVNHALQRKLTKDEYQWLNEGGTIRMRYLSEKPEVIQLMPE